MAYTPTVAMFSSGRAHDAHGISSIRGHFIKGGTSRRLLDDARVVGFTSVAGATTYRAVSLRRRG